MATSYHGILVSSPQPPSTTPEPPPKSPSKQLRFVEASPQVYAYPDETDTGGGGESGWQAGRRISYEEYQNKVLNMHVEEFRKFRELTKW